MNTKVLWNTPTIKIPDEFAIFTKNSKTKVVKPLKGNNLKTINKKKAINIIEDKNINNIVVESHGRKIDIDNNDIGLKKMMKERKPRKPKVDKKLIETTINKKPTIKISNPIITKKEKIVQFNPEVKNVEKIRNKKIKSLLTPEEKLKKKKKHEKIKKNLYKDDDEIRKMEYEYYREMKTPEELKQEEEFINFLKSNPRKRKEKIYFN